MRQSIVPLVAVQAVIAQLTTPQQTALRALFLAQGFDVSPTTPQEAGDVFDQVTAQMLAKLPASPARDAMVAAIATAKAQAEAAAT